MISFDIGFFALKKWPSRVPRSTSYPLSMNSIFFHYRAFYPMQDAKFQFGILFRLIYLNNLLFQSFSIGAKCIYVMRNLPMRFG